MKKLLILFLIAISLNAQSQVDAAFTAKFINVANTAKEYYLASEGDKPEKLELAIEAVNAFRPITSSHFSSKLYSMLNSPAEMAKIAGPVGFINCIAGAANTYTMCWNNLVDIPPPPSNPCTNAYQYSIIQCGVTHLVHY